MGIGSQKSGKPVDGSRCTKPARIARGTGPKSTAMANHGILRPSTLVDNITMAMTHMQTHHSAVSMGIVTLLEALASALI